MASIAVTINGKSYRMGYEEQGEEEQLLRRAAEVDARINGFGDASQKLGHQHLLVMAAVSFADDLSEARRRIAALETEAVELRRRDAAASRRGTASDADIAAAISKAAVKIADAARKLNADN